MLNELYLLSRNLQKCGIPLSKPHQCIEPPGKNEGFIVGINGKGLPETIEYVTAEQMKKLWTLRKGNHNSFPFIRLKSPAWKLRASNSIYKDFNSKRSWEEKKSLIVKSGQHEFNEQDFSLAPWTKERLEEIKGKDSKLQALTELAYRMPKNDVDSFVFVKKLAGLILQNIQQQTVNLAKTILLGDLKEREQGIGCDAPLFFDVSDWAKYKCRVASPEMGVLMSKYLPRVPNDYQNKGVSAFGGIGLKIDSYPKRKFGPAGQSYLFSMNDDAPCHNRYRMIASQIFPVSSSEVEDMDGALQWCLDDSRKGKTWMGVPNSNQKQDLLISYLEEKPKNDIALAKIFTSADVKENELAEPAFEIKSKAVCDALRGIPGLNDSSCINVLVISKVDEGRAQVVISAAYSVKNIICSVEEWIVASKNHPFFSLFLPGSKGEKAHQVEPPCPSPTDVMKLFQYKWIKKGLDKRKAPGISLRHVYDLFLGETFVARVAANSFLAHSLRRLCDLFIGFAGADHARTMKIDTIKKYPMDARKTVLHGISILAIILYKLGIRKEDYMKNAAFNIGRMFALADKLHQQYCYRVRKNEVPPQLIGNALMHTVLDSPTRGLALLGERMLIYQAWATKVQGDDVGLTKWTLAQMGQVSANLKDANIPTHADDAEKAQILLGYLAHENKEKK